MKVDWMVGKMADLMAWKWAAWMVALTAVKMV